jgi:hypothetical protein
MCLCSCAELLRIATPPFDRPCFVDTDEAGFFDEEVSFVDTDESSFVDRDEEDFLDEEQANKGLVLVESSDSAAE